MNEMKERLFRHYNLNKTALGKLVKGINKTAAPVSMSDVTLESDDKLGAGNNPLMNWNALLGANKFLMALQRDIMQKEAGLDSGIDAKSMPSIGNMFSLTKTNLEIKENGENHSTNSTTKAASLWGRARNVATRPAENHHINEGYSEETFL